MSGAAMDWINLIVRWAHLIVGIAWIGSSFYFVWLDASLRNRGDLPKGVFGESWMVHGGGFYNVQKYSVAPQGMPEDLHWFKWEAYSTWITGFFLLILVYYLGAEIYLIDRAVMDITAGEAVFVSVASLALGWVGYDLLCRSPIGKRTGLLAVLVFALAVAASLFYTHVFSGRGAFIHIGALLGSIMVANVFFIIIPNQKKVVADLLAGRDPDPALGKQAKQRSLHNNYLTLPVLLMMISNHYPMAFAAEHAWLIAAGVILGGGMVRHFFNRKNAGVPARKVVWYLPGAAAVMLAAVMLPNLAGQDDAGAIVAQQVSPHQAMQIVQKHCTACHAQIPTYEGFAEAPAGVVLERPEDVLRFAPKVRAQAVATQAMPLGNMTEMTEDERKILGAWLLQNQGR